MFGNGKTLPAEVHVRVAQWASDQAAIAAVRRAVFIVEQGVPEALEWDADDAPSTWLVATAGDEIIGTARLTPARRLGRMAVLRDWRRRGVGAALLDAALAHARQAGWTEVVTHAQRSALGFYARFGFLSEGPEFSEAGIVHRLMRLSLQPTNRQGQTAGREGG